MNLRLWIPNMITLANLACGVIATMLAIKGVIHWAAIFIFLAAFFDLMDGLVARALNAKSALGAQLDSLCDLVSFGVAPAMIMVTMINSMSLIDHRFLMELQSITHGKPDSFWDIKNVFSLGLPDINDNGGIRPNLWAYGAYYPETSINTLVCGLVYVFAGAIRLARFNTLPENKSFFGLAIPAAALLIAGSALAMNREVLVHPERIENLFNPWLFIGITLFAAIFMLVNVRMFSFKLKSLSWADSKLQYIFLILCIPLVIVSIFLENFWLSIPLIVLLYIIVSLIDNILNKDEI